MEERDLVASSQYGDLLGTCSFDGHGGPPIAEIAELIGVDIKSWLPIAANLWLSEASLSLSVLAVERGLAKNIPDLMNVTKDRTTLLEVHEFTKYDVDLMVLRKLLKRGDILAVDQALWDAYDHLVERPSKQALKVRVMHSHELD